MAMAMATPRIWTPTELSADVSYATQIFCNTRINEPLGLYEQFYHHYSPVFEEIIDRIGVIAGDGFDHQSFAHLMRTPDHVTAVRYLAAPPISEDDLCTLAGTTLSQRAMTSPDGNPTPAERVCRVIRQAIDPFRFPWIREGRDPTPAERFHAISSSSSLLATRRLEAFRRGEAKTIQEAQVKAVISCAGFVEVGRREINVLDDAPSPGHFCGESKLGPTRADVVVRLRDTRVLAIECKVSNTEVNSFKRISHEALGKASKWMEYYGSRQVVPAAVLTGCFHAGNLADVQTAGLYLFWSHRLDDLAGFLATAV